MLNDRVTKIDNKTLGLGYPVLIAAEVGINHNGDMNLAHQAIDAAAAAGADAVKFQNYETSDFLEGNNLSYTYESQGQKVTESQWEMFKRCELSVTQLAELKKHCDQVGVIFFSTPTSEAGIEILQRLKCPVLKNGSDFLTNLDLVQTMAKTGIPTILSTGMATVAEIDDAVTTFREAGGSDLILLHCTSSYPTPPADINLKRIPTLANTFGCISGFSDHSEGIVAAIGAVTLGACFIEKHFTVDRSLPGPDHRFSSDPDQFKELVQAIRMIEKALGNSQLRPTASEQESRKDFRLSCQAKTSLRAGTVLQKEHISYRRPGTGIPPKLALAILGLSVKHDVPGGHVLKWEDFHG
ncbi:N-acetylneuraminate synthase family protein [Limnospira fusiformis]|uniref:N-acetylneuraminate synthase family protein n=1 Tax=Limnospira fusiformis TaxID=54297 RepID=UPI0034E0BE8C